MPEIKPDMQSIVKIKIVGVGGSGSSVVNRMIEAKIRAVDFVVMNTDLQALNCSKATHKIHLGKTLTKGLGAGMNPEVGKKAAEESINEIRDVLRGADIVFITCGLGGGTGTGASPVVADVAKSLGALTVAVVTKPFTFEGAKRRSIADMGYINLAEKVDTIITIFNDRILQIVDKKTSLLQAFRIIDDVLVQGVEGVADIVNVPGLINVDFADLRVIMANTGSAMMGIGTGKGENKVVEAARAAVNSPLLELAIDGARGVLFTITGGSNLGMHEVHEAAKLITKSADENAKIIFGAVINEAMKDEVKIIVIATDFSQQSGFKVDKTDVSIAEGNDYTKGSIGKTGDVHVKNDENARTSADILNKLLKPKVHNVSDVDGEDLDIPAFLRKKK